MLGSIKAYNAPKLFMAFVALGESLLKSFALLTLSQEVGYECTILV
jgi:hypothetical protein